MLIAWSSLEDDFLLLWLLLIFLAESIVLIYDRMKSVLSNKNKYKKVKDDDEKDAEDGEVDW